jgi:ABC-type Fe3+ transport system substrate-binding protein
MDVVFGGQTMITFVAKGYFKPIKPQFMLPGVTNPKNWVDGHMKWVDRAGKYMFIGSEYIHCWPVINTAFIKDGSITKWSDLLKPEYQGKIASYDPVSGPGQAQGGYIADNKGIDFFKKLYIGQKVKLTRDSRQLMEWAARGVNPIVLAGLPVQLKHFANAGIKTLKVVDMQDGHGVLLGGSSVIVMPKKPAHPNAATVFVNWYASQPGQKIFSTVWETPSRRVDVDVPAIPDFVRPKPGIKYLDQYTEDWYLGHYRKTIRPQIIKAMGGH